jgi:hypothetical protein
MKEKVLGLYRESERGLSMSFGCRKLNEEGKLLNEANYFYILGLYRELVREMERDSCPFSNSLPFPL